MVREVKSRSKSLIPSERKSNELVLWDSVDDEPVRRSERRFGFGEIFVEIFSQFSIFGLKRRLNFTILQSGPVDGQEVYEKRVPLKIRFHIFPKFLGRM